MPQSAKKPCSKPGCPNLTNGGYCGKHHKQKEREYENSRESAAKRGYTREWYAAVAVWRARDPENREFCVECKKMGILEPGPITDHIVPHKGDWKLFWDQDNWEPMCEHHHNSKTAKETDGFGKNILHNQSPSYKIK